ncbi:MAG: glutamine--fructose-6-phosphate transaminase (isomerizing) [Firmicutes bacterium]|nr:glutamine--fructose-6-phosphate transaminase (isomerizing) [Bacillota bacterium]
MCGIVGYIGYTPAAPVLLEGLKRLEYRGYDSAGIAVQNDSGIHMHKSSGKVDKLIELVKGENDMDGFCGIGHTRWATHGSPTDTNAHPHMSADGKFALVHNGIIENFAELKAELEAKGIVFASETDTEVIVQLIAYYYKKDIRKALLKTVSRLEGSYAIGLMCSDNPNSIYAARSASPLIIGLGDDENYFASDITALVSHTKNVIDLDDGEFAEIRADGVILFDSKGHEFTKPDRYINWDIAAAEKSGYEHFMLKEIMEQPAALKSCIEPRIRDGRIVFDELDLDIKKFNRIILCACGSAYHAGFVGSYILEKLCRIPAACELASELRYRDEVMDDKTLVIGISQSGETADSIAALKECKAKGATVLSVVNVVGSSIAKLSDYTVYTWAGPEIAVATTKGYTTQVTVLCMLAIYFADALGKIDESRYKALLGDLKKLPSKAQRALDLSARVNRLAEKYHDMTSLFFIGRNLDYASCLEGSLKLKEISYIHSEAYAAGELKHGTIALIEPGRLVIALCCYEELLEKSISNIQQVKARGADVLALAIEKNRRIYSEADNVLAVPKTDTLLTPVIEIIPLQLFADYVAKKNGCDIDKPKNLAKSVTVE